jgi:hypothetical protein
MAMQEIAAAINRVEAGPTDMHVAVRIAAHRIDSRRLRALVEHAYRRSPIPNVVRHALTVELRIDAHAE